MADLTLQSIETALILAIQNSETLGSYCRTISGHRGELLEDLEQFPINCPAVFVELEGSSAQRKASRLQEKTVIYAIYVVQQNFRGNEAGRLGEAGSIGTLTMLQDAQDLLIGNDLGLSTETTTLWNFSQLSEDKLLNTRRWSAYRARYQSQYLVHY